MIKRRFSFLLSLSACFVAVEAGALVICVGTMILDSGIFAILEGIAVWAIAQPIVIAIALCSMPPAVLLRIVLGLAFSQPRLVALISGSVIGSAGALFFALSINGEGAAWFSIMAIGLSAGIVGGWAWWRVEKPLLNGQEVSETV